MTLVGVTRLLSHKDGLFRYEDAQLATHCVAAAAVHGRRAKCAKEESASTWQLHWLQLATAGHPLQDGVNRRPSISGEGRQQVQGVQLFRLFPAVAYSLSQDT